MDPMGNGKQEVFFHGSNGSTWPWSPTAYHLFNPNPTKRDETWRKAKLTRNGIIWSTVDPLKKKNIHTWKCLLYKNIHSPKNPSISYQFKLLKHDSKPLLAPFLNVEPDCFFSIAFGGELKNHVERLLHVPCAYQQLPGFHGGPCEPVRWTMDIVPFLGIAFDNNYRWINIFVYIWMHMH